MFASKDCAVRIMQPQPISDVKPLKSIPEPLNIPPMLIVDGPFLDLGISGKLVLYVNQTFDSTSLRNAGGHDVCLSLSSVKSSLLQARDYSRDQDR